MVAITIPANADTSAPAPAHWNRSAAALTYSGSAFFRYRLILSLIFQRPLYITNIHKGCGLARYEESLLLLLDKLTDGGELKVDRTGTSVHYKPGQLVGGTDTGESIVHDCGTERNLTYFLEVVALIAPFCKRPVNVILKGITHGSIIGSEPTVDHFMGVVVPLYQKMGLFQHYEVNPLDIKIIRRGLPPEGGGAVEITCGVIPVVKPFKLVQLGRIKRIRGRAFVSGHKALVQGAIHQVRKVFNDYLPDVWVFDSPARSGVDGPSKGYSVTLLAETMKGAVLGCSATLTEQDLKPEKGDSTVDRIMSAKVPIEKRLAMNHEKEAPPELLPAEVVGRELSHRLLGEISIAGVIDSTYQHIPLIFAATADTVGVSEICLGPLTCYSIAIMRHLRDFCGVTFVLGNFIREEGGVGAEEEEGAGEESAGEESAGEESAGEGAEGEGAEGEAVGPEAAGTAAATAGNKNLILKCLGCGVRNVHKRTF